MQKISYVIPCYRSQHTVGGVVAEIAATSATDRTTEAARPCRSMTTRSFW